MIWTLFILTSMALWHYPKAQDPLVVAPAAYKREFENQWVRVVRVHYEPRERIASHDHPQTATIYVYLRDSGPVRFVHTGEEKFVLERPAVKAGGFRLGRATRETHEVESLSDAPTDLLRIELKTQPLDARTFRGRFPPLPQQIRKNSARVRFENGQVRIVNITCAARQRCVSAARLSAPLILVSIRQASLRISDRNGAINSLPMKPGEIRWMEAGEPLRFENAGETSAEFLQIELKTK